MDLHFIHTFCHSLPNPYHQDTNLVNRLTTILRRSLRHKHLVQNQHSYSIPPLIVCIVSFITKLNLQSLLQVYNVVIAQNVEKKYPSTTIEQLEQIYQNFWQPTALALGLIDNSTTNSLIQSNKGFLSAYEIVLVPNIFFSKTAASILLDRITQNGGKATITDQGQTSFLRALELSNKNQTLIICADISLLKYTPHNTSPNRPLLRSQRWMADCLRDKRLRMAEPYLRGVPNAHDIKQQTKEQRGTKRQLHQFREENPSVNTPAKYTKSRRIEEKIGGPSPTRIQLFACEENDPNQNHQIEKQNKKVVISNTPKINWACEVRTKTTYMSDFPMNDRICELLGIVHEAYVIRKDRFHATGYERAIAKIRSLQHEILTVDDARALTSEKSIGDRMVLKIEEIIKTGHLEQAAAILSNENVNAIKLLCNVWGIGPVKALTLVSRGIQTIEQLRLAVKHDASLLDKNQKIGLKHYEDLLHRIPREEIEQLEMYIRRIVKGIDEKLDITIAGSYLRGKKDCGDVDVLIHGDGDRVHKGFPKVKQKMRKDGVLTDDLVDGNRKYFGVFKMPGRKHARLDLFAVPNDKYPFALLTYTGSAVFNRSMRAKARALGYTLSHERLQRTNRNKHEKKTIEPPITVDSEKEIFFLLDIPYCLPENRSV